MLYAILLFIIGLALLIIGGDWFVDGAVGIARRYHMPEILLGATVVSIGTTLPEVLVSATSAATGHGELAYGNAIGSIICNTSLVAAFTVAIAPSTINKKEIIKPTAAFFIAAVFYALISYVTGNFSRLTGIVLLLMFLMYMTVTIRTAIMQSREVRDKDVTKEVIEETGEEDNAGKPRTLTQDILILVFGAAFIAFGAKLLVENGTIIAREFGVPESVIGLTFVALGTSLPELVTAIISLIKGHGMLSLGNVIGANLFNLVLVSGAAITISPFELPASKLIGGINSSLVVDLPIMFIVMLLLTVPALIKGKLYRWQGILLLVIYAAFSVYQFV